MYLNGGGSGLAEHNVLVQNTNKGFEIGSGSEVVRNNIVMGSTDGIDDNGTGNSYDFNYYYNNTEDLDGGGAISSNSITGTDPNFYAEDTGTVDASSTTTIIIDAGQAWTANEWVGAAVKVTTGGTDYWAGVTSNTAERLFLAPALGATPAADDAFEITEFYLDANSGAIGQGAQATGSAHIRVNMGARLGYIDNATDGVKYNFLQQAEDAAGYSAGDSLTIYSINQSTGGAIGTTITDNGPTVTVDVPDWVMTANNQYEGMYLYMSSGTNSGNAYLITDSVEGATDTITILTDSATGFATSDYFNIVDRTYTKKSTNGNVDLGTSGSTAGRITWMASGSIILDAENLKANNVYAGSGLTRLKFSDSIVLNNFTSAAFGGDASTLQTGGYYVWGANGTLTSPSVTHASVLTGGTSNVTIAFTTVNAVPVNGDVAVTFPAGFDISGAAYVSGNTSATVSVSGQVLTINLGTAVSASEAVSIVVSGIVNTNTAGSAGTYAIETQDAEDVPIDTATGAANTFTAFEFTAPTSGTTWGAGTTQTISWAISGTVSAPYTIEYWDGSNWYSVRDSGNNPAVNVSGTTQEWAIPVSMTISSTTKVRIYDNDDPGNPVESSEFSTSGGLTMSAPTTSSKWAIGTAHTITWTESGNFTSGVKLEYLDDDGSTWRAVTGGGVDDTGICTTGCSVVINGDGSKTKSFSWTPSDEAQITAGYATANVRVSDANTSNPASSVSSGAFTIAGIVVSYTPPDRTNAAVAVGAGSQTISWTHAGASYVKLQYYSPASSAYVDISGATALAAADGSYAWTVPDDVGSTANIKAMMVGADAAEGTSGVEGSVSDTLSSTFTIYGALSLTSSYNAASYLVDSSSDRVPITWSGSSSISGITFEYTESNSTPSYTAINSGQLYTTATGATTGYNWASGTGTTWWQPTVTGSTYWLRLKDANDALTVSALGGAGDYFAVSGVSITALSAASPYTAGQAVTISGNGAGSASVKVYYATSSANAQSAGTSTLIGTAAVAGDDTFSQAWTVPDSISETIYLRVESGSNASVNNTYGPYTVTGALTVTDPGAAWTVGETTNTLAGTVTGDIDTVDLQYSTDGTNWTDFATNVSIGDNSGTTASAFTITSGNFTVPDVVSAASFRVRVKDSTDARASALLGMSSSSSTFQVKGLLAITSPTSVSSWYVGNTGAIGYNATGTALSDVIIEYAYRKSATGSNDSADYTSGWTEILNTSNSAYMGSGTSAVARTYDWAAVADVVETLIGTGVDEQDPSVYAASGNECWLMVRMRSANADTVYSQGFRAKYYTITWQIKNMGGAYLSTLNVSEPAASLKPEWTVSDYSLATSAGDFIRYYPYYSTNYSPTFTEQSGGIDYPESVLWQADSDKTVAVTIDTSPSTSWEVTANVAYDYTSNTLNVTAWLEKQGLQLTAAQQASLSSATTTIYNSAGTRINVTSLSDAAADANGNYAFAWDTDADSVNLVRGQQYSLITSITYNSQAYTGVDTFSLESTSVYDVQIDAIYNATNDSIIAKTSLLQNGTLVTDNANMALSYFRALNAAGTDLSGDLTPGATTTTDTTNSIYETTWDPSGGLTAGTLYTLMGKVTYKGNEYSGTKAFSMSEIGTLSSDIAAVSTKVDAVQTTTSSVSTKVDAVQTTADSIVTKVDTVKTTIDTNETAQAAFRTSTASSLTGITTSVGAILEDTATTIPAQITADLTAQLAKGVQAELLTRPGAVETGSTTKIRYRTTTGLTPVVTVYDADNTARVSAASMTEIGTTGVYQYALTLDSSWGTGEYTVIASESTKSSVDSLILDVVTAGTTTSATTSSSSGSTASSTSSSTATTATTTLSVDSSTLSTVSSNVNKLDSNLTTLLSSVDVVKGATDTIKTDVDKLLKRAALIKDPQNAGAYLAAVEAKIGAGGIPPAAGSILDQLGQTESSVGVLGPTGSDVLAQTQAARNETTEAVSAISDIRDSLQLGNIEEAMGQMKSLSSTLSTLQETVSKIPTEVKTDSLTEEVKSSLAKLAEMAEKGGFKNLVPDAESVKSGDAINAEDVLEVRNSIAELKELMLQVRTLMDKEVNKPVVSGWLEGNGE